MEQAFLKFLADQKNMLPPGVLGIGDDAAVLSWPAEQRLVVCSDLISDETDFHLADVTPAQIGRKALAINLSDIAAMACEPTGALLTLLLPKGAQSLPLAQGIYEGASRLAQEVGCAILGGDTNTWPGKLAVSVTLLGRCPLERPLLRSGAQPGDVICVTGSLGGSILGHHLEFQPRISEAIRLHRDFGLTAGMDLSDGISIDLPRLCEQSGVGAQIDVRSLPISDAANQLSQTSGKPAWWHALNDGEDFELLFTLPPQQWQRLEAQWTEKVPVTKIGTVLPTPQVTMLDLAGQERLLLPEGFSHQ